MNGNKRDTAAPWKDPDDAPELTDAFVKRADEYVSDRPVRNQAFVLPRSYRACRGRIWIANLLWQ